MRVREAERRVLASEERSRATQQHALALEERLREAEQHTLLSERRAREAEEHANERVKEAEQHAEERVREAVQRSLASEERAEQVERQWVVEQREIHITEEVLGGGGWEEVKVAEFRGTRVAAKSLYQAIMSNYYQQLFIREMNMAARIRHPNLVQFIGACMEGGMVILMNSCPLV